MSLHHRKCSYRVGRLAIVVVGMSCPMRLTSAAEQPAKIPSPETLTLTTQDAVQLRCTYYPGGVARKKTAKEVARVPGKEVVPVILLHGWDGQRREFDFTAGMLQRAGYAVIVPDLRGHGESTKRKWPGGPEQEISRARMGREGLYAMLLDVEAVKKFLVEKNNLGELNIELLCVVGAETGAIVAVNWAAQDWSREQLPAFKQGQHVKAIVLLSPCESFKGATLNKALQHPVVRGGLSVMIVAGKGDRKGLADATAIYKRLERFHSAPPSDSKEGAARQTLRLVTPDTTLSGTKLLKESGLTVNDELIRFIYARLASRKADFRWNERKSPLPSN